MTVRVLPRRVVDVYPHDAQADVAAKVSAASDLGRGVRFVAGVHQTLTAPLDVTTNDFVVELEHGAIVSTSPVNQPAFNVTGQGFQLRGSGRLTGPGMESAVAGCHGVTLTAATEAVVDGVEIDGFYHAVRPNIPSTNGVMRNCNIHHLAFVGTFLQSGWLVANNRFDTIGTTSLHHSLYMAEGGANVVIQGNVHTNISGSAINLVDSDGYDYNAVTVSGEAIYDSYGFMFVDTVGDFRGLVVEGVVGANLTDRGIVCLNPLEGARISATFENCAGEGVNLLFSTGVIDVAVTNCGGDAGAIIRGNGLVGSVAASGCSGDGVRLSGATHCVLSVSARSNTGAGVRFTSSASRNVVRTVSYGNTGLGVTVAAGCVGNTVDGVSLTNSAGELSNEGTATVVSGLVVA